MSSSGEELPKMIQWLTITLISICMPIIKLLDNITIFINNLLLFSSLAQSTLLVLY